MDEPRIDHSTFEESLHQRVTELEELYARQKRTSLLLVIGMVGAVALGIAGLSSALSIAGSGSIVAREFVLRDDDGVPHGMWRIQDDGSSTLSLNDRNGVERVRLRVLDNGAPGLALADAKGRSRVVLSLLPDLTGSLLFADEDENTRALFGLGADGASTLVFADPSGDARLGMGVEADGRPTFSMTDSTRGPAPDPNGSR
jgi:hypothetical protein